MKDYIPAPLETADVQIPEQLLEVADLMARNVHEVWSQGRMREGWTYGPKRDDAQRKHPCLRPYDELSQEEKQYDINTSQETIKLLLKLGYRIVKE